MTSNERTSQKNQDSGRDSDSSSILKPVKELKEKVTNGIKEKVQKTVEENVSKVAEKATKKTIENLDGDKLRGKG